MNKCAIIVSGGTIDSVFALSVFEQLEPEYVIGADKGLSFLYENQIMPTHIVGDFDSVSADIIQYYKTETEILIREFRPEKDASDTEIAIRLAVELGVKELVILGGTGTRLDHVMANIQTLKIAHDYGVRACLMDVHNRISLAEKEVCISKENTFGEYFSIFPFGGIVEDISIEGAKYPLAHYRLEPYDSRCVSNEVQDEEMRITFPNGMIILMETRDRL